jgi:hypothetical protein
VKVISSIEGDAPAVTAMECDIYSMFSKVDGCTRECLLFVTKGSNLESLPFFVLEENGIKYIATQLLTWDSPTEEPILNVSANEIIRDISKNGWATDEYRRAQWFSTVYISYEDNPERELAFTIVNSKGTTPIDSMYVKGVKISEATPMATSLLWRKAGDLVVINTPNGVRKARINKVENVPSILWRKLFFKKD